MKSKCIHKSKPSEPKLPTSQIQTKSQRAKHTTGMAINALIYKSTCKQKGVCTIRLQHRRKTNCQWSTSITTKINDWSLNKSFREVHAKCMMLNISFCASIPSELQPVSRITTISHTSPSTHSNVHNNHYCCCHRLQRSRIMETEADFKFNFSQRNLNWENAAETFFFFFSFKKATYMSNKLLNFKAVILL